MKVGLILTDLRKQLFQKLIPQDEKERANQELYLEKKLQSTLALVERQGEAAAVDELKVNACYKRMTVASLMGFILKGNEDTKFAYASAKSPRDLYHIPIEKKQGYTNPEIVINHVYTVVNHQREFWIGCLRQQLQEPNETVPSEKITQYIDGTTGAITRNGVKALLYTMGYLKAVN